MKKQLFLLTLILIFNRKINAQETGAKWLIPPIMEGFDNFEISPKLDETRFVVKKKELKGLFGIDGKMILPVEFNSINIFSNGWIEADSYVKHILLNKKNENMALPYDKFKIHFGIPIVYKKDLCGVINQEGEEIVSIEYESFKFDNNLIVFTNKTGEKRLPIPEKIISKNEQRVIDAKAKSVIRDLYFVIENQKSFFLNAKKDTIIPPIYVFGQIHPNGYIIASFTETANKYFGVIDKNHQTLYPFTATKVGKWTQNGMLPLKEENKWGVMKFPEATAVIPFGAYDFVEVWDAQKAIFLAHKAGKKGLINVQNEVILPIEYVSIGDAVNPAQRLIKEEHGAKWALWNRNTNFKTDFIYDVIRNYDDSLCFVSVDREISNAIIDSKTGRMVLSEQKNVKFKKIGNYFLASRKYQNDNRIFDEDSQHGLFDRKGNVILPLDSVEIYSFPDESYLIVPQYFNKKTDAQHFSAAGKLIRSFPKQSVKAEEGCWISRHLVRNKVGMHVRFSYLDQPNQENYYENVDKLVENLRRVKLENLFGFTDNEGRIVIPVMFQDAGPSENGLIRVKYKGKWGVLKNPRFDYFEEFEKNIK
jgi:hypothetical protein